MAIILGLRFDGDAAFFQKKKTQSTFEEEYFQKPTNDMETLSKEILLQIVQKRDKEENFVNLLMI